MKMIRRKILPCGLDDAVDPAVKKGLGRIGGQNARGKSENNADDQSG